MTKKESAANKSHERQYVPLHNLIYNTIPSFISAKEAGKEVAVPYIVGTPGGGKTKMFLSAFGSSETKVLAYTPGLERVEKFGGIPEIQEKVINGNTVLTTQWTMPQLISDINQALESHARVIVLFDDWHICDPEIQKIGFEVFTHYSLNGHKFDARKVHFVLMGNDKSTAGAKLQLSAIKNRCAMYYAKSDIQYWIQNYAVPTGIHPTLLSFFEMSSNTGFFQEEESTSNQFGSPRSWSSFGHILKEVEKCSPADGPSPGDILACLEASVSSSAAQAFFAYYQVYSKVPIDKIYRDKKVTIPADQTDRYALMSALYEKLVSVFVDAHIEEKKNTKESKKKAETMRDTNREVLISFTDGMMKQGSKELVISMVSKLTSTPFHESGADPSQMLVDFMDHKDAPALADAISEVSGKANRWSHQRGLKKL